jgi:nicotinate-nucleotide adenylyltransferase
MRIAIFGGSFNPPHVAHQMVALYVLETAPVDGLWFVPCFRHPFDKPLEPFEDRFRMCDLAAVGLGWRVRVSDVERTIGGPSRTLNTIRELGKQHPEHEFSLVIGADLVAEVPTWHGATELQAQVPFIVVGRGGVGAASAPVAMPEVSSTEVRARLRDGQSVEGLVPRVVLDYIYERRLYAPQHPQPSGPPKEPA